MNHKTAVIMPLIVITLSAGFVSISNADMIVMKLSDQEIQGESNISGYEQAIILNSFTWGTSTQVDDPNGGNLLPNPPKTHNTVIDKKVDRSTPQVVEALHSGKVFNRIEIHVLRSIAGTPTPIISLVLENAFFQSHSMQVVPNTSGSFSPHEGYSIFFQKFTITYTQVDLQGNAAGSFMQGWDYTTNAPYTYNG